MYFHDFAEIFSKTQTSVGQNLLSDKSPSIWEK